MIFKALILSIYLLASSSFIAVALAEDTIVVVRGDENYPPNEMLINDKLVGIHIDLTREVAASMNLNINYISVPWKRAVRLVQKGSVDAISYLDKTPEREEFAIFNDGNIISSYNFVFIILKIKTSFTTPIFFPSF